MESIQIVYPLHLRDGDKYVTPETPGTIAVNVLSIQCLCSAYSMCPQHTHPYKVVPSTYSSLQGCAICGYSMCPQNTHPYKVVPSVETACALNTLIPTRLCSPWIQHVPSTHSSLQGGAVCGDSMCPQHTHPCKVVPSVETACALNTLIPTRWFRPWRQHVPSTHSSLQGCAICGDSMCPQHTHPYKVVPSVDTACALNTLIPTRWCRLWRQHVPSTHSSLQGGCLRRVGGVHCGNGSHQCGLLYRGALVSVLMEGGCIPPMPVDVGLEEARGYGR